MTPRLWISLAAAGAVFAATVGLYWKGRLDADARSVARVEAAQTEAAVSRLETRGERELASRVEIVVRQREAVTAAVTDLTTEALRADDAETPLDPARLARLRDVDRRLCDEAPDLAGCAASGNAGGGGTVMRASEPS